MCEFNYNINKSKTKINAINDTIIIEHPMVASSGQ